MRQIYKAIQKLLMEQNAVEFEQLREQTDRLSVRRLQVILSSWKKAAFRRDKQLGYRLGEKDAKTEDLVQTCRGCGQKEATMTVRRWNEWFSMRRADFAVGRSCWSISMRRWTGTAAGIAIIV